MFELLLIVGACTAGLTGCVGIVRFMLNRAKADLDAIGLPMTLSNVFFLSANVEAAAREAMRIEELQDDLLLSREIVRAELKKEFQDEMLRGASLEAAYKKVIDPDVSEHRARQLRLAERTRNG